MAEKIVVNLIGGPADGLQITTMHDHVKIVTPNRKRAVYKPSHENDRKDGGLWMFAGYDDEHPKQA